MGSGIGLLCVTVSEEAQHCDYTARVLKGGRAESGHFEKWESGPARQRGDSALLHHGDTGNKEELAKVSTAEQEHSRVGRNMG